MDKTDETIITTLVHIHKVQKLLSLCIASLQERLINHDKTKIFSDELVGFAALEDDIRNVSFGSTEYNEVLRNLRDTLEHHYTENRHHPEHFKNGINGMGLIDLLEMTVDWMAAAERSKDGNVMKSLPFQKERYGIGDQLYGIIHNTVEYLDRK